MNLYLKASLLTLLTGALITGGFALWRKASFPSDKSEAINLIDELEKMGMKDFSSVSIDGKPVRLSDFKGKIVVLNFWASWCGPCVEEIPSLIKLVNEFKGKVVILAVSGDSAMEDITDFLKAFPDIKNENIHVIWDQDRSITKTYEVQRLPESFLVGPDFKLNKKIVGTIDWHTSDSIAYMNELLEKNTN